MKKFGFCLVAFAFALIACGGSIETVPSTSTSNEGGGGTGGSGLQLDCVESAGWINPIFMRKVDGDSGANVVDEFETECGVYNAVAKENTAICQKVNPSFSTQIADVYCHDVSTQLQQLHFSCAALTDFQVWLDGITEPFYCAIHFTAAI